MAVITLSRTLGSLGDVVAQSLCRDLGYRLFDKGLVLNAAKEAGITGKDIEELSEDTYKVRGLIDRIFSRSGFMPYMGMWPEDVAALYAFENQFLSEEDLLSLMQEAVRWAYHLDWMVIVGRGSQVLLHDYADVLHVRLDAPVEIRVQRVSQRIGQTLPGIERDAVTQARELVHQRDMASAEYLKRFYHTNWADPLLYHAVFNTGTLAAAQVVEMIKGMAASLPSLERSTAPVA